MTTLAQHRAEMNALTITVAVETQLFRWAAEVDRLKGLNAQLVEALADAHFQFAHFGDEADSDKEVLDQMEAALQVAKGEAVGKWKGRPFKFPGDAPPSPITQQAWERLNGWVE